MLQNLGKVLQRKVIAPHRDTIPFPRSMLQGNYKNTQVKAYRPNMRAFANTQYVNRAITCIKNPILELDWEIKPAKGIKANSELKNQIATATNCFKFPNADDSFRGFIDAVLLDFLTFGSGVIEQQVGGDPIRPLWLWPVDAESIQIYSQWSGKPTEARYVQTLGYSNVGVGNEKLLRNDEIVYIKDNPSTYSVFGMGKVEIAYNIIRYLLGAQSYANNVASNASPENVLFLGNISADELEAFREYWTNYVEGRGQIPMLRGLESTKPDVIKMHLGNDEALYLKWQEFLVRALSCIFGVSPRKLGVERDVNRSTAEVSEDEDWDLTIKPTARIFESYFTREIIHAKLKCYQLEFAFVGLDREDEESTANIFQTRYKNNSITPNEWRMRRGEEPIKNPFADMLAADVQIAIEAARGAKQVDDANLKSNPSAQSNTDPTNTSLSKMSENTKGDTNGSRRK